MNILVTGANGQLGNEMRIVSKGSADRYIFTDICGASQESEDVLHKLAGNDVVTDTELLDITDIDAVRAMVAENDVKVIVNCAAYTNVDAAESNYDLAERLNAGAPGNLATVMQEVGGLLVHISTDYVFGKEPYNTPCREDRKGTPTGVYGLTKLHGEKNIIASGCDYVIIRTAWLYSEFGKNFLKTMLNLTVTKPALKVVFDQVGTPTYALDLAKAIAVILDDYHRHADRDTARHADSHAEHLAVRHTELDSASLDSPSRYPRSGIYHFSNEGVCSWYDFTKAIQEYSGQTSCDVQPCHSSEFPSPVTRPAFSVLDKTKIKEVFSLPVPYWTCSLRKCLENINKNKI